MSGSTPRAGVADPFITQIHADCGATLTTEGGKIYISW